MYVHSIIRDFVRNAVCAFEYGMHGFSADYLVAANNRPTVPAARIFLSNVFRTNDSAQMLSHLTGGFRRTELTYRAHDALASSS